MFTCFITLLLQDNLIFGQYVLTCIITSFLQENLICEQEFARANANMILMGGVLVGALAIGIFADM